jgi:integrase
MTWWLETEHRHEVASTTYVRYLQLANFHLLPFLGQTKLIKLTRHDVNALIDHMVANGQSLRSAQQARALLSACLNAAIEEDLIGANPVGASRKIRLPRFEIEPLAATETARVIQLAPTVSAKLRLELALYYGLRQGEALGLRWEKISFEKGQTNISHQIQTIGGKRKLVDLKTKSSYRTLPLDEQTIEMFRRQKIEVAKLRLAAGQRWVDNDLVFPNAIWQPFSSRWDYEQWHRSLVLAGVSKRRLHDARHTCATLLLEQGLDIEVIRYWLGHASIEMTSSTYIHLTSKTARLGSQAVADLRKQPREGAA